jgi:hypothetical protein
MSSDKRPLLEVNKKTSPLITAVHAKEENLNDDERFVFQPDPAPPHEFPSLYIAKYVDGGGAYCKYGEDPLVLSISTYKPKCPGTIQSHLFHVSLACKHTPRGSCSAIPFSTYLPCTLYSMSFLISRKKRCRFVRCKTESAAYPC